MTADRSDSNDRKIDDRKLEYSEIIDRLQEILDTVRELEDAISIDQCRGRIAELEKAMGAEHFWDSNEKAQEVIHELKLLRSEVEPLEEILAKAQDDLELAQLAHAEDDNGALADVAAELDGLDELVRNVELMTILSGKHDASSAYLSVHAGAGGTESCDWAAMLMRMYKRFADRQGFQVDMVDRLDGEEAGVKSVTFHVKGAYAFGYLRAEIGTHRLVRKSPFDAKNKRHTSFAAVDVIPELADIDKDIEIAVSDLRIDTYRAGGAGGQHVNTTDSAVRITHLPSGIVVQCQNERSQHANRNTAMKMLRAALILREERKREEALEKHYGEKGEIAWGNQIRSYVLDPYKLVKDRRTGLEIGNVDAVLDGEIFPFIEAYLKFRRRKAQGGEKTAAREPKSG